ncbi:hypothetical protein DFJ66_3532 [Saccharothrix variisporea]|uniref:Prenyltransferase/squalene oxidase-like repeat protein n=2 Tax=Saccharothrix variisporea TaxID=543527 RepID=A0A495XAZ8_9PSEU|nr:hypothetical protein DFJ66_3532 [Saccharothrix variisporea]
MLEAARVFMWRNARVVEQRRFEFLFDGGAAEPVVAAVVAYRNEDGGFGHALEPDGRGPTSQPLHTFTALNLLHEVGDSSSVAGAVGFFASVAGADGGLPNCLETARDHPRAPWWQVGAGTDLLMTALAVSVLHRFGVEDPWVDRATDLVWELLDGLGDTHPYEVNACVRFLDAVPDRGRAEVAAKRLGELVRERGLVDLGNGKAPQGYAEGETHKPHHYAPTPDSLARRWFSDEEVARDLDLLEAGQQDDGGWTFPWAAWTPVTTYEWRPIVTIEALKTLKAYGRTS